MSLSLEDPYGRRLTYLRLSVTDRCQFRCLYCMPPEGISLLPKEEYLTPEEMERFVRAAAEMGVWRLRLTGGEPLLRKDIVSLVARFSTIPGIRDLALTTNGEYLADLVSSLKEAGLKRVNVSLDSLNPKRFEEMTFSKSFYKVWRGIERALEAGLGVKINVVAMQGMPEADMDAFADFASLYPVEVRFIEFMPLCGSAWKPELVLPIASVRSRIADRLRLIPTQRGTEVAESYRIAGGRGRVGFIGSMTEPFCSTCSRIRMNAAGKIQLCLFSRLTHDLLPTLRRGASIEEIQEEVRKMVLNKPVSHPWVNGGGDLRPEENAAIRSIGG